MVPTRPRARASGTWTTGWAPSTPGAHGPRAATTPRGRADSTSFASTRRLVSNAPLARLRGVRSALREIRGGRWGAWRQAGAPRRCAEDGGRNGCGRRARGAHGDVGPAVAACAFRRPPWLRLRRSEVARGGQGWSPRRGARSPARRACIHGRARAFRHAVAASSGRSCAPPSVA